MKQNNKNRIWQVPTAREIQIMGLSMLNYDHIGIARIFKKSQNTINSQIQNAYRKFFCNTMAGLVARGYILGLRTDETCETAYYRGIEIDYTKNYKPDHNSTLHLDKEQILVRNN
jgi:DNA-binding CsgD family transcriptional regulator